MRENWRKVKSDNNHSLPRFLPFLKKLAAAPPAANGRGIKCRRAGGQGGEGNAGAISGGAILCEGLGLAFPAEFAPWFGDG